MNKPLVSIIIPVYNAEKYLSQCIESVMMQTWTYKEIIIVDDGSTDNSLKIAQGFQSVEIKVLRQENKGASSARNYGYASSSGDFIKFLDADDLINPEMVSRQMAMAEENPQCIISGEWGRFYNDDLGTFKSNPEPCWQTMVPIDWICSSWSNTSSMTNPGIFLIPRKIIERGGPWDETLSLLDDTDFFARIILSSKKVAFAPGSVLYYRSGVPGNLSSLKSEKGFRSMYQSFRQTIENIMSIREDAETRQLSANMLQLFIYYSYPCCPDLIKKAEQQIKNLAKPTLPYQAGPYGKALARVLGWKLVKQLRYRTKI